MNLGDGLGAWADTVILSQLVVFLLLLLQGIKKRDTESARERERERGGERRGSKLSAGKTRVRKRRRQ